VPYIIDKAMKSEGIRIIIKPTDAYLKQVGLEGAAAHMEEIVEEVNKNLQSYKKITMTTVTDEALEMTSTKKVKRFVVMKKYKLED
ncbi:MAG: long-chain fatty acid--CoA ligase, partial [Spirochaetales bacterium]|nr:long-chain fatty acid--CoA ligase [Candidatus Physcosoma equi]